MTPLPSGYANLNDLNMYFEFLDAPMPQRA